MMNSDDQVQNVQTTENSNDIIENTNGEQNTGGPEEPEPEHGPKIHVVNNEAIAQLRQKLEATERSKMQMRDKIHILQAALRVQEAENGAADRKLTGNAPSPSEMAAERRSPGVASNSAPGSAPGSAPASEVEVTPAFAGERWLNRGDEGEREN